jgi:hypothetical protein
MRSTVGGVEIRTIESLRAEFEEAREYAEYLKLSIRLTTETRDYHAKEKANADQELIDLQSESDAHDEKFRQIQEALIVAGGESS